MIQDFVLTLGLTRCAVIAADEKDSRTGAESDSSWEILEQGCLPCPPRLPHSNDRVGTNTYPFPTHIMVPLMDSEQMPLAPPLTLRLNLC